MFTVKYYVNTLLKLLFKKENRKQQVMRGLKLFLRSGNHRRVQLVFVPSRILKQKIDGGRHRRVPKVCITGTDSWAPKAYCWRRAAVPVLCEGPLRQPPSLYLRYRSLFSALLPSEIHSLVARPRGLQSTPEQSLITLPLVFPQREHLVEARFQARTDRIVRHGSTDFSSFILAAQFFFFLSLSLSLS